MDNYRLTNGDLELHFANADINADPQHPLLLFTRDLVLSADLENWIRETFNGLRAENPRLPVLISQVEGKETYKLPHPEVPTEYVSVFKRRDGREENNQGLGYQSEMIGGIRAGRRVVREASTYLLDHPRNNRREGFTGEVKGFCGVPPTMAVLCMNRLFKYPNGYRNEIESYRLGSLQKYVNKDGNCGDLGFRVFESERYDPMEFQNLIEEVHRICLLDLRFANSDPHGAHILYRKKPDQEIIKITKLIPVDRGLSLPMHFKDCEFVWLNWEPSKRPFNPDFIEYINSLDSTRDIDLLENNSFQTALKFERTLHISTKLLQIGVEKGLTPFEIGTFMKLRLETIVTKAIEQVVQENSEEYNDDIIMRAREESVLEGMTRNAFEGTLLEKVYEMIENQLNLSMCLSNFGLLKL